MSLNINPNTLYYLLIYLIILMVRFFKTYRQVKAKTDGKTGPQQYFFVSLEFVYSSVGIVILLLATAPQWAPVTIVAYIVLVLCSAFLDAMGEDFPVGGRLAANIVIMSIVAVLSVVFNQGLLYPKTATASAEKPPEHEYVVAIPYTDYSFRKYVGERRFGDRELVFVTPAKGPSRSEAVLDAQRQFWDEKNASVEPFDPSRPKTPQTLVIDRDRIVTEVRQ